MIFYSGVTVDGSFKFVPETQYVPYGSIYPIVPNLPDISCMDAIKSIMSLFGLFAYYDMNKPDTVVMFSVDEIYRKMPNAKNWTDKLITGNQSDSIKYTFQDYAQQNFLKYLKDETVKTDADGYVEVDNQTLERTKDLSELKYAASDTRDEIIYIPVYTREDTKIKYKKSSNRIASIATETSSTATFPETMHFRGENGIIKRRYEKYQEILLRPKVITATFKLTELDLYNIDLLTPVYLEQTGQYYAIIKIQEQNGAAKCELLQMYVK